MKTRSIYLDAIKVLAILLVVFNHTAHLIDVDDFFSRVVFVFLLDICKVAVPLFIMVSGSLLLKRKTTYKEMYGRRILRILVPMLIVILMNIFIFNKNFKFSSLFDFIFTLIGDINGDIMPYWIWYLFMLLGLYLMTPFIQKMIKNFNDKDYKYFILIFCVLVSLANYVPILTSVFGDKEVNINNSFLPVLFSVSVGYYVFGSYISNKKISEKEKNISVFVLILWIILGSTFLFYGMFFRNITFNSLIYWDCLSVSIPSMCIFLIFRYYSNFFEKRNILKRYLSKMSGTVFGIYLFHPFLIDFLSEATLFKDVFAYNSIFGSMFLTLSIFIILMVSVYIVKKIRFLRQFL